MVIGILIVLKSFGILNFINNFVQFLFFKKFILTTFSKETKRIENLAQQKAGKIPAAHTCETIAPRMIVHAVWP